MVKEIISKLYFDKNEKVVQQCAGKRVLDIGFVDHDVKYEERTDWLHRKIKDVAKEVVGLDSDREAVKIMQQKGYKVTFGNAENFFLGNRFDVIVAGDLIEHLSNVGNFLDSVKRHMKRGGRFVLTTPNCLSFSNLIELVLFGKIIYINKEHTHWYDENTLKKILKDKGFLLREVSFVVHTPVFIGESPTRTFLKKVRHFFC